MEKKTRTKLCPEITDPERRSFLDMVPIIRKLNAGIVSELEKEGEELSFSLPGRELKGFFYRAEKPHAPVVFEYHGGGYVFGSAAADDGICAALCRESGCNVISVDYRLAPETVYPGQLTDAWDMICFVREHGTELGLDADRIACMGFSAGGNLAASVALLAAQKQADYLKAQVLHYPFLDYTHTPEEKEHFEADVDPALIRGFTECYCTKAERCEMLVSPICAAKESLCRVAPALIIAAERDALREEALHYHGKLVGAGVRSEYHVSAGAHHCYMEDAYNPTVYERTTLEQVKRLHSPDFREKAREALTLTAEFLKKVLFIQK